MFSMGEFYKIKFFSICGKGRWFRTYWFSRRVFIVLFSGKFISVSCRRVVLFIRSFSFLFSMVAGEMCSREGFR